MSKKAIVWLVIGGILVLLVGLGIFGYVKLTNDPLPEAPVAYSDVTKVGAQVASDVLLNGKAVLGEEELNGILVQVKDSINKSMNKSETKVVVQDLFGEIRETDLVMYCRALVNDIPVNATIEANLQFISPDIEVVVKSVKIGDIKIPGRWVTGILQKVSMPEGVSVTGDRICYDTSSLNSLIVETARKNETVSKVEGFIVGIADFFNKEFDAEEFIDFQIKDVCIENNKIVIKTSIF